MIVKGNLVYLKIPALGPTSLREKYTYMNTNLLISIVSILFSFFIIHQFKKGKGGSLRRVLNTEKSATYSPP